jgi:protein MpaA
MAARPRLAVSPFPFPLERGHIVFGADAPDRKGRQAVAEEFEAGRSVRGQAIRGFRMGDGPDVTLFLGVHHGNEKLGKPLLERLMDLLRAEPERLSGRRAVFVPVLNPDGYDDNTRQNANGVDLNRNLPTKDWRIPRGDDSHAPGPTPASEPETRALINLVESERPAKIVTIHAPLLCVNWNGVARAEAANGPGPLCAEDLGDAMARHNGYPTMGDIGYPCPGSFGSWAGAERRIPTITLELGRDVDEETAWAENRDALLAALAF